MSIDEDARRTIFDEKTAEKQIMDEFEGAEQTIPAPESGRVSIDFSFLLAKTGTGTIESYIDHPLNYKQSRGFAQVLRGFTGMAGDLDLAIIDIALGGFEMMKERNGKNGEPA